MVLVRMVEVGPVPCCCILKEWTIHPILERRAAVNCIEERAREAPEITWARHVLNRFGDLGCLVLRCSNQASNCDRASLMSLRAAEVTQQRILGWRGRRNT